jgi:alpha-N-arabinofuranosidase
VRHRLTLLAVLLLAPLAATHAADFHVAVNGKDANAGAQARPFRTIQRAADLAQPGDVITVHEGTYRERVNPPRGGESDAKRIVYRAAPGERVEIKGSEVVRDWVKAGDDLWKVTIPNSFFGSFNPYSDLISGDWFNPKGREHHTGAVYLNGHWLTEAATLTQVQEPVGATPLWFAQVDQQNTTIWAQFRGVEPDEQRVEVNVRRTVFYPEKPGINYITVRGFRMMHAATPWSPPTAEQIGLIGTHWSKGWIIEDNEISYSTCTGVTLGKYGDEWDNRSQSAEGYNQTIRRALENGWSKGNIGHHIVRNNHISHCEQAGIVGSLGAVFSTITGNSIHDIHVRQLFSGAEMAGIKIHAAIDADISRNHIHHSFRGIWLDWMAQGARVSRNLIHDIDNMALFLEVNHGPLLVDNNICLAARALHTVSRGTALAHNLLSGIVSVKSFDGRRTPFHKPHSTEVAGLHDNPSGDDRYYNNIFIGEQASLSQYDETRLPVWMDGNVFVKGASPSKHEKEPLVESEFDPGVRVVEKADGWYLELTCDPAWASEGTRKLVTTELLGRAAIPDAPYERPDGTSIRVNTDYLGKQRNESDPTPGPLESPGIGSLAVKVR